MSSSTLLQVFKIRLCNFKASSINTRGSAPFCLRGNFDGKPFNTEYFHGQSMTPMWALDIKFEYHTPSVDVLSSKYLLLEAYGADVFLGMCRIDILSLASGPSAVELTIRDGMRVNGTLTFDAFVEHVTNTTLQMVRLTFGHVGNRGGTEAPSPYLSFGFQETGPTLESSVAPNAVAPEWDRLPPLHKRTTHAGLGDTRICFELKHARNGFSPSITDPVMATFEISLSTLPIEIGRDCSIPIREMVHSLPSYPFPFSASLVAVLEVRNAPRIAQMRSGLLTEGGVIGGLGAQPSLIAPPVTSAGLSSTSINMSAAAPQPAGSPYRYRSPPRHNNVAAATVVAAHRGSPPRVSHHAPLHTSAPIPESIDLSSRAGDIEVLEDVADKHSILLAKVQSRLQEVSRRRAEVAAQLSQMKHREEQTQEATSRRRAAIEADLRTAVADRDRLQESLKSITLRREEEVRVAAVQASERERMRRALEDEQQEVATLQSRVLQLRAEMTRHLEEEEAMYLTRLREAEEARRRAQQDADDLAQLEARLTHAEQRAAQRHREDDYRHNRGSASSPQRRY